MKKNNFIITNSGDMANQRIKEYLGIVSSHIITGTGFFSDFSASFTDFFGGRSETYQKHLEKIQNEAIDQLIEKAKKRGANGIISIRIDHDEISGKGMQMFMVTVYGTAIIAEISQTSELTGIRTVDTDGFERALQKRTLLQKMESMPFWLETADWEFVNENLDNDIAIRLLDNFLKSTLTDQPEVKKKHLYCFNAADQNFMIKSLYTRLESEIPKQQEVLEIITECNLIDYDHITKLLLSDTENAQENGLLLLESKKRIYNDDDLKKLKEIKYILADRFKIKVEFVEEKVMLSSKMKQKWICCKCGNKTDAEIIRCSACSSDQYGFKNCLIRIGDISKTVDTYISILETCLAS